MSSDLTSPRTTATIACDPASRSSSPAGGFRRAGIAVALGTYVDGNFVESTAFIITVGQPEHREGTRIVIAAAPKSGSTFTASALNRCLNLPFAVVDDFYPDYEQDLDYYTASRLTQSSFVLQMHLRPYKRNIEVIERLQLKVAVTWRNLADTIVSADDHVLRWGASNWFYDIDKATYALMDRQHRYQMLIRWLVPWYVNFYVGWRKYPGVKFSHYEVLSQDPIAYLSSMLENLGVPFDLDALRNACESKFSDKESNFNVGLAGRSIDLMSPQTQQLLEDMLRAPFVEDITELVEALPWNQRESTFSATGAVSALRS